MKTAHLVIIGILGAIIGYAYYLTTQFPIIPNTGTSGPEFFPRLIMYALAVCLIILLISTLRGAFPDKVELLTKDSLRAYITIGILLAYLFGIKYLGFVVSTVTVLFVLTMYFTKKRLLTSSIVSVGLTGIVYVVFKIILAVPVPEGMLI